MQGIQGMQEVRVLRCATVGWNTPLFHFGEANTPRDEAERSVPEHLERSGAERAERPP
jgi:hypothetical protein